MSIVTEVPVPTLPFDTYSVSGRALTNSVYKKISIGGQSGSDGHSDIDGIPGSAGRSGAMGMNGRDGENGTNGYDADSGRSGEHSEHAIIWLSGTAENLNVQLKIFHIPAPLYEPTHGIDWNFTQQHTAGGHGGNGGQGGKGGEGGNGGNGDDDVNGVPEYNAADQDGGPGGNGGCAGAGGNGGSGGNGGDAGNGGHVQVRSVDPRLFMLIEMICRAGVNGKGGRGGDGGKGGRRGLGGTGGPDGYHSRSGYYGYDGMDGCVGDDGSTGSDGRDATDGSILYAVVDKDGNVHETGPDKYHASVIGYTITNENNDGIYEPDSDFFITNVKWINNGAMPMPDGAILLFPSTKYITNDIKDVSFLSNANINQVSLDSHRFKCHLNAPSTFSINKPYIQPVKLTSQITLSNHSFSGSEVSTIFTCQYPIQITTIEIPSFLGPNERAIVTVSFTNISARSYGVCPDSDGSIEFIFGTHPLIRIIDMNEKCSCPITPDGRTRFEITEQILPQTTKRIKFEITLDAESAKHSYESLFCHIDLLLRTKLIEKRINHIRVVPIFKPDFRTDVLLVTNSQVNRAEFLAYQILFQLFNFTSQTWPIERYGTMNHPEITWLHTTDLIIFIYSDPQSTFNIIKWDVFLQHMNSSEKAGFICIGSYLSNELDFALFDYNNLQFLDAEHKAESEARHHLWFGTGFQDPTIEELNAKGNKLRRNYEKQEDHRFLYQVVYDDTIRPSITSYFTIIYGRKYVFKSTLDAQVGNRLIMIPTDSALLTTSHLPFQMQDLLNTNQLDGSTLAGENKINISEINLNSRFGRLLCALFFYQGFAKSYTIISELANCTFKTTSNQLNFHQILVSLVMSIIEREYDRRSVKFQSSAQLLREILTVMTNENNIANSHSAESDTWLHLLIQSLYEYINSKFSSSFPWWCCGWTVRAKQQQKLQEILKDLHSLTIHKVERNEQMYPALRILRLQKLADLYFPAADVRRNCVRPIAEIQAWQSEQNSNRMQPAY